MVTGFDFEANRLTPNSYTDILVSIPDIDRENQTPKRSANLMVQIIKKYQEKIRPYTNQRYDYVGALKLQFDRQDLRGIEKKMVSLLGTAKKLQAKKDKLEQAGILRATETKKGNGIQFLVPQGDHNETGRMRIYIPTADQEDARKYIERFEEWENVVSHLDEVRRRLGVIVYHLENAMTVRVEK